MIATGWLALGAGPARRNAPWRAVAAASAITCAIVLVRAAGSTSRDEIVRLLRFTEVALAAAGATCLEDGCESLTETTPTGRLRRRLLSVVLTFAACTAALSLIVVAAGSVFDPVSGDTKLPIVRLVIELAAVSLVGWSAGALAIAVGGWRGSGAKAAAAMISIGLATLADPRLARWLWQPAPRAITIALVAGVGFCALSRDAAGRGLVRSSSGPP